MSHKYDEIVKHLTAAFDEMRKIGLADVVAKGGVGEILLAHNRNHELIASDKGADGKDSDGCRYEYKVSITDQFNFYFGTREEKDPPESKVKNHFSGLKGAFCAKREGEKIKRIVFVPTESLVPYLIDHFSDTEGKQLNKNFRFDGLLAMKDAVEVKP
ncbi:MAG TPA: hypothetical protein VMD27_07230 [Candidatus Aquilonibacter sp.]|nr:hypothetical protein [Candidatus Aquilonibacter sp.]